MKHLYYIRHGLSEGNKTQVWSGQQETPLAAEGHEQAKRAGAKAAQQGLSFDVIISSPLSRAQHTAQHVARATGYPIEDIVIMPELIERSFGELEGTVNKEAKEHYLKGEAGVDHYKNVERLVDLQWRTNEVLQALKARPEDTILIVGHGAFARTLRRSIEGVPLNVHVDPYPNGEIFKLI